MSGFSKERNSKICPSARERRFAGASASGVLLLLDFARPELENLVRAKFSSLRPRIFSLLRFVSRSFFIRRSLLREKRLRFPILSREFANRRRSVFLAFTVRHARARACLCETVRSGDSFEMYLFDKMETYARFGTNLDRDPRSCSLEIVLDSKN